ncbi:MAG: hypothetical protein ACTSQP_22120 [Promethearchaeota archaeon]
MVKRRIAIFGEPQWSDILDEVPDSLKEISRRIFGEIDNFLENKGSKLIVISGPFGVGKTELEYTCFRKIIKGKKFALFGTLEEFFNCKNENNQIIFNVYKSEKEQENSPLNFKEFLEKIINSQINLITNYSRQNEIITEDVTLLLPGIKQFYGLHFSDYIRYLSEICELQYNLNDTIENLTFLNVACIIDEMESRYELIIDNFKTLFHAPFRELAESIEKNLFPLTIMAFGLKSIYEMAGFSGDVERRMVHNRISLIKLDEFPFEQNEEHKNFYWWISRGRIGWYRKVKYELEISNDLVELIETYQDNKIENVPWIDFSQLNYEDYLNDDDLKELFKKNIIFLHPNKIEFKRILEKPGEFELYEFYFMNVSNKDELIEIDNIISNLIQGLRTINNTQTFLSKIIKYATIILESISINKKICFGFIQSNLKPTTKDLFLEKYFLKPLFSLIHNFIWDFEPTSEETNKILEHLNDIIKMENLYENFKNLKSMLREIDNIEGDNLYGQLSLYIIHKIFPLPFYSPILEINENEIEEQKKILNCNFEEFIGNINAFPILTYKDNIYSFNNLEFKFYLIFLDDINNLRLIFTSDNIQNRLKIYELFERQNIFIFFIKNHDENLELKDELIKIIKILMKSEESFEEYDESHIENILSYLIEINKMNIIILKLEALNTFIRSIIYNYTKRVNSFSHLNLGQIENYIEENILEEIQNQPYKNKIQKNYNYYINSLKNQIIAFIKNIYKRYSAFIKQTYIQFQENFINHLKNIISGARQAARPFNLLQIIILGLMKRDLIFEKFENSRAYTYLKNKWKDIKIILEFNKRQIENFLSPSDINIDIGYNRFLNNTFGERNERGFLARLNEYFSGLNPNEYSHFREVIKKINPKIEYEGDGSRLDIFANDGDISQYINNEHTIFFNLISKENDLKNWYNCLQLIYIIDRIEQENQNLTNNYVRYKENYKLLKENIESLINDKNTKILDNVFSKIKIIEGLKEFQNYINKFLSIIQQLENLNINSVEKFLLYWLMKKPYKVINDYYEEINRTINDALNKYNELRDNLLNQISQLKSKINSFNFSNNFHRQLFKILKFSHDDSDPIESDLLELVKEKLKNNENLKESITKIQECSDDPLIKKIFQEIGIFLETLNKFNDRISLINESIKDIIQGE